MLAGLLHSLLLKMKRAQFARVLFFSALVAVVAITPSRADDTEVFFGQNDDAFRTNPNVLFILDISGSMREDDNTDSSRLDRLKEAMRSLLDQSNGFNVGIMTFQGSNGGGAIRYPVSDLNAVPIDVCEGGVCPDESITVRPIDDADDAYQNDETLAVVTDDLHLAIGSVEIDTNGQVITSLNPEFNQDVDTTPSENLLSLSTIANDAVAEVQHNNGSLTWKSNQNTDTWFFENEQTNDVRFAYRFDGVELPPRARIIDARIVFKTIGQANQAGFVDARIIAEQSAFPAPLPTNQTFSNPETNVLSLIERAEPGFRTNTVVSWDSIKGTTDNPTETPDTLVTPNLKDIVQEIANLPAWQQSNSINFMISAEDSYVAIPTNVRKIYSYGAGENLKPVLEISYENSESTIQRTTSLSVNHIDEFVEENAPNRTFQNKTNSVSSLFHAGPGLKPRRLAIRFPNIDIPQGASISSANLILKTRAPQHSLDPIDNWVAIESLESPSETQPTQNIENPVEGSGSGENTNDTTSSTINNLLEVNISSELNADLEPGSISSSKIGPSSEIFVPWGGIANTSDTEISSPNIALVINEIISAASWEENGTISLVLSAPGDYTDIPENVREILTSTSDFEPVLDIGWEPAAEVVEDTAVKHTSAVRFRNVHVPPNSTIQTARLVMHASDVDGDMPSLNIIGEKTPISAPFTTNNNDIGSRQKTSARVTWNTEPWVAVDSEYAVPDVTNIVKEITGQPDWCGGNPLTLLISSEDGKRFAQSIEQNPSLAPALEITYTPNAGTTESYCSNSTQVLSGTNTADDAAQLIGANNTTQDLNDSFLSTSRGENSTGERAIGLRFRGAQLPAGTIITSATLSFTADQDITDPINTTIAIESTGDANAYSNANPVLDRTYGNTVDWTHDRDVAAGDNLFTADVTSLLNDTITRADWNSGNSIAFKITSNSGSLDIVSFDGDEVGSPRLIVYFQTETELAIAQNRQRIQKTVDDTIPIGATPIVESLFEAHQYFGGRNVEYGRARGTKARNRRWFRVSHPDSYEGGTVKRLGACTDDDLNSLDCRTEVIEKTPTRPRYTSPIESECQSNHIVLLSDGEAVSNNAASRIKGIVGSCVSNGTADPRTPEDDEECGVELVTHLANNDQLDLLPGDQTITTHTIGFNNEEPEFLQTLAEAGGGIFEPAESASELLLAFRKIFNNVSQSNASFVAPAASISQFNRLRNSTDVFYGMFKPSGTARWLGNLKKYAIDVDEDNEFELIDANGNPAIDENSGSFAAFAKSFWSSVVDGDHVELGGAREQIGASATSYLDRNVYTFTGTNSNLTDATNEFSANNLAQDSENIDLFSLPSTIASDPEQVANLIDWSRGKDVLDEDQDNNTDDLRSHIGDPMHATPLVASYSDTESVIYVATNDGFLHAIDADDGSEHFSFIPKELYKNMFRLFRNEATQNRDYGLDGGMNLWHEDTNDDGLIDSNETAILYIGMRRGGDSYFALDISNYQEPKYLWSIKGGVITSDDDVYTADGDYTELSSTWSLPVKTKIVDGSTIKDVIIFGGGYDENQDPSDGNSIVKSNGELEEIEQSRSSDSIGRAIYIADAETGELIWKTSSSDPQFNDMNYSIPSQVRSIDINFDGITDQLYVGDMGGQIWRMDFDNDTTKTDTIDTRITAGRIAEFAGDTPESNRRFYYPPDVSVISVEGEQVLSIAIGSGWRAHPLDEVVEDRLYSLRSPHVFGPPIDSFGFSDYTTVTENSQGMIDVTDDINAEVGANDRGWFLRLENSGEKIVSSSLTFNNQIAVTTYSPSHDFASCDASLGTGRIYALNVLNGAPVLNFDENGSDDELTEQDRLRVLDQSGIPPEVSILFPQIETNEKPFFQVGKETIEELDGGEPRKTTFWQEVTEGHDE